MKSDNTDDKTPKAVEITVSSAKDFKNRKHNSVSIGKYKELKAKDKNLLSERELRQISDAEKRMQILAERFAGSSNFASTIQSINSAMPKIVDTLALSQHFANNQLAPTMKTIARLNASLVPAIETIRISQIYTKGQVEALASIHKSISSMPFQKIIANYQSFIIAPLIARTMFADFHTKHARIMRELKIDLGSLSASIEFSKSETIDLAVNRVTDTDVLTTDLTAVQSTDVGGITFTDNADMRVVMSELQATRNEVAELKQIILNNNSQDTRLITPSSVTFQRTSSTLQIGPYKVKITLSSKQAQFARTLVSSPENITKKWDIEEVILEAFGERVDKEHDWIVKIRSYIHQLNQKVMLASSGRVDDFFVLDGIDVYVNPKYFNL